MNTKAILGLIVATMFALFAVNSALAVPEGSLPVSVDEVSFNDVELDSATVISGAPGETVPVVVRLTANENLRDLKLKVWIEGYKSDVSASTARFDVVDGSTYIKRLSITLPSVADMDANPEGLTLYVRVADKNDYAQEDYAVSMERESYSLNLLSVDAPSAASAGEIIALDIVLKNIGGRDAEDTFVTASIPELGISKKAYFGDVYSEDNVDEDGNQDNDNEDARERRIYLVIPANTVTGDYGLEVKASNYDATSTVKKVISITGLAASNSTNTNTGANTTGNTTTGKISTSVIVLTVVLVIIFVVLLIVLIVLLTKKPSEKIEDFGETSYY